MSIRRNLCLHNNRFSSQLLLLKMVNGPKEKNFLSPMDDTDATTKTTVDAAESAKRRSKSGQRNKLLGHCVTHLFESYPWLTTEHGTRSSRVRGGVVEDEEEEVSVLCHGDHPCLASADRWWWPVLGNRHGPGGQ